MPAAPGKHGRHSVGDHSTKHRPPEKRGTARKRGYSRRWERFRRAFLSRHPLCEYCWADGQVTPATLVDHDLPHRGEKELFWNNTFTACCQHCHNGLKAWAEARMDGDELLDWVAQRKGLK